MRLFDKLDGRVHSATMNGATPSGHARTELSLAPGVRPCRILGPIEASIALELVSAESQEEQALTQAGYAVPDRGWLGSGLAELSAVLRHARFFGPTRQDSFVPKTGRHEGQGPARHTPGPVPGAQV
jgi:hypothetical protein